MPLRASFSVFGIADKQAPLPKGGQYEAHGAALGGKWTAAQSTELGRYVSVQPELVIRIVLGLERHESLEIRAVIFPIASQRNVRIHVIGIKALGQRRQFV